MVVAHVCYLCIQRHGYFYRYESEKNMSGFVPTIPDKNKIFGADISFYQDDNETPQKVDFKKMRDYGTRFVIIRAGQNTWPDQDFKDFWAAAKGVLPRGAYFYLDSRASIRQQAKLFAEMLFGDEGELPWTVDFEQIANKKAGITTQLQLSHLTGFLTYMQEYLPNYKKTPIIYTGHYFWKDFGSSNSAFEKYPLWIARYKATEPLIPPPWKSETLWQFADTGPGKEMGVESNAIDLNYFRGTEEQFKQFIGGTSPDPVIDPPVQTAPPRKVKKIIFDDGSEQVIS